MHNRAFELAGDIQRYLVTMKSMLALGAFEYAIDFGHKAYLKVEELLEELEGNEHEGN